jgi:hypothetical protein
MFVLVLLQDHVSFSLNTSNISTNTCNFAWGRAIIRYEITILSANEVHVCLYYYYYYYACIICFLAYPFIHPFSLFSLLDICDGCEKGASYSKPCHLQAQPTRTQAFPQKCSALCALVALRLRQGQILVSVEVAAVAAAFVADVLHPFSSVTCPRIPYWIIAAHYHL